ncbi:unnamed protein product [Urochloa decumbens]|uniref:Uncharacterized protein n=1 Tax=Urochloa decumbens TaxID=240449 RepID=A0ABC9H3M8_9POAL
MVLGLCSCFRAAPAAAEKKTAPAQREEPKKQQEVGDQEAAGGETGDPKTAVDWTMVAKDENKRTPLVIYQFLFHSRPGLL